MKKMCFLRKFIIMVITIFIVSKVECDEKACIDDLSGKGYGGNFNVDKDHHPNNYDYKGLYLAEYLLQIQEYATLQLFPNFVIPPDIMIPFCQRFNSLTHTVKDAGFRGRLSEDLLLLPSIEKTTDTYLRSYRITMKNLERLGNAGKKKDVNNIQLILYFCHSTEEYMPTKYLLLEGLSNRKLYVAQLMSETPGASTSNTIGTSTSKNTVASTSNNSNASTRNNMTVNPASRWSRPSVLSFFNRFRGHS